MTKLILIRHGETKVNAEGKNHTTGDSAFLTQIGQKQMKSAADAIKGLNVKHIICSDEKRAIESAMIPAVSLNLGV